MYYSADIGVIGGSGLYELDKDVRNITVDTPYGKPSDAISLLNDGNKTVAFLPRHGKHHTFSPQEVNYRANIDAFAQLGVKALISVNCAGSLKKEIAPGHFVITDQYINLTSGRKDTFYQNPEVVHLSSADPYDEKLRKYALEECEKLGITAHDGGTTVVVNGPRFSTRAESKMFAGFGGDLLNMTQYPEAYLCMEKEIPVVNIALITDYDVGLEGDPDINPVTIDQVNKTLAENNEKVKALIFRMIERIGRK